MEDRWKTGCEAVQMAAGKITRAKNLSDHQVKQDGSLVLEMDKEIEASIRSLILHRFPDDGFLGEETARVPSKNGYIWICDPIDGTRSLINREKWVSTSLALMYKEKVVISLINNPFFGELFSFVAGGVPTKNEKPLPVARPLDLGKSLVHVHPNRKDTATLNPLLDLWKDKSIGKLVMFGGSMAYNLTQVSEGTVAVYISTINLAHAWDIRAGVAMIEAVGGLATDLSGTSIHKLTGVQTIVFAANFEVHTTFLRLMNSL